MIIRFLNILVGFLVVVVGVLSGCNKSGDNPAGGSGGPWTLSGKTYVVGSPEPVSGVTVSCGGITATSGPDGSYELRGIPQGNQTLTAQKALCDSFSRAIDVRSELTYHIYLTHASTVISGVIRNTPGEPIEGAKVTLREFSQYTDELGRYAFFNIPRVAIDTLFVSHPDYIANQAALSLNASEVRVNVVLTKEWIIYGTNVFSQFVDETLPSSMMYYSTQLLLGIAGTDSLGRYRFSRRYILVNFDIPEIVKSDTVTLVDASLELKTDAAHQSFPYETYTVHGAWDYRVVFNNQPPLGWLVSSGTVGDGSPPKYWPVLGLDGMRQIIATIKAREPFYGVEIRGGTVAPKSFYSSMSAGNRPRAIFKVRY
jgi:hypothetical protein